MLNGVTWEERSLGVLQPYHTPQRMCGVIGRQFTCHIYHYLFIKKNQLQTHNQRFKPYHRIFAGGRSKQSKTVFYLISQPTNVLHKRRSRVMYRPLLTSMASILTLLFFLQGWSFRAFQYVFRWQGPRIFDQFSKDNAEIMTSPCWLYGGPIPRYFSNFFH